VHRAQSSQVESPTLNLKLTFLRELALSLLDELRGLSDARPVRVEQGIDLYDEVCRFETELIRCALQHTGGHQVKAARLLGLKTTTLNNKIKQYKIQVNKTTAKDAAPAAAGRHSSASARRPKTARTSGARKFPGLAARKVKTDARLYG
jgi:Bacterial regulatory protein, Fis family